MKLVAFIALCTAVPSTAFAQACCAGAAAFAPARLQIHEDYLAGVQLKALGIPGSFSGEHYLAARGATEIDLEESLNGTVRVLTHGQLSATVPFDETYRSASGLNEFGGSIGDIQLNGRWDFTFAGSSLRIPGLALLAGIVFPTGRPPESAKTPLAVDATGQGAWRGAFGAAVEQSFFGHLLLDLTGSITISSTRHLPGLSAQQAPQGFIFGAVGWGFDNGLALAVTGSFAFEGNASIDGKSVPHSGRTSTQFGAAVAAPIANDWRVQGNVFGNPPCDGFGRNQPASVGATFTLIRSWS